MTGTDLAERGQKLAIGRDVGADAGEHVHTQAEEFAVGVEGEFDVADIVTAVFVGEEDFGSFAFPLDGAPEFPGGPEGEAVIDVLPTLGAEAAANVTDHDADFAFGHLEDHVGEHVADAVRIVHVGVEGVTILALVVGADGASWFHVLRLDAGDHVTAANDVGGFGEGGFGGRAVAAFGGVGNVVGVFVPEPGRVGHCGVGEQGDGGERVVFDFDQFGGVLGLGDGFGHHHGDDVADVADAVDHHGRAGRGKHRRSVTLFARHGRLGGIDPVVGVVLAGVDGGHAGRVRRGGGIDGYNSGMGMRGADEHTPELARQRQVVLVVPLAGQQPFILEPTDRLADTKLHHYRPSDDGAA